MTLYSVPAPEKLEPLKGKVPCHEQRRRVRVGHCHVSQMSLVVKRLPANQFAGSHLSPFRKAGGRQEVEGPPAVDLFSPRFAPSEGAFIVEGFPVLWESGGEESVPASKLPNNRCGGAVGGDQDPVQTPGKPSAARRVTAAYHK